MSKFGNPQERSEMIESFMSITAVISAETAQYWLEASNFNMDSAIELFFSSSGTAATSSIGGSSSLSLPSNATNEFAMNVDDPFQAHNVPLNSKYDMYDEGEIRKPDNVKKQRLMSEANDYHEFISKRTALLGEKVHVSTFACASDKTISEKDLTLAKLFQPPHDIMSSGSLAALRERCKAEGKWLLVNIQSDEDFNCHLANRDLWSHDNIKEIVSCVFLFWQVQNISIEGEEFCKNYKINSFPHIAVLDPRTGASIWTYNKKISEEMFTEKLMDFLGSHPYPDGSNGPTQRPASSAPSKTPMSVGNSVNDLTGEGSLLGSKTRGVGVGSEKQSGGGGGGGMVLSSTSRISSGSSSGEGFDPKELLSSDIGAMEQGHGHADGYGGSMVKILFKFPLGQAPRDFSVSTQTTVFALAAKAAVAMDGMPAFSGKRFELLTRFPKKLLSKTVISNPLITLSEIEITVDTAIIVELID